MHVLRLQDLEKEEKTSFGGYSQQQTLDAIVRILIMEALEDTILKYTPKVRDWRARVLI